MGLRPVGIQPDRPVVLAEGLDGAARVEQRLGMHGADARALRREADGPVERRGGPLAEAEPAARRADPHVGLGAVRIGRGGRLEVAQRPAGPREGKENRAALRARLGVVPADSDCRVERLEGLFDPAEAEQRPSPPDAAGCHVGVQPHGLVVRLERLFVAAKGG